MFKNRRSFKIATLGAVVAGSLLVSTAAQAYLLPASYLVGLLVEKRREQKIQDLSIELRTEREGTTATVDERLYLKSPSRMRRVEEGDGGRVIIEKGAKTATGTEGKLALQGGSVSTLLATLLAPSTSKDSSESTRIIGVLQSLGVDTKVVALGRLDGRPAYIIGARIWEGNKPQVWLDKETILPVRWIFPVKERDGASNLRDVRLLEYGSALAGHWFPRVIEVYHGTQLVEHTEVADLKRNQSLPETLFTLP